MTCNGKNHGFNCICDFRGGNSKLIRQYKSDGDDKSDGDLYAEFLTSLTYPIKCKCGEDVYFYQSPYGGKVFFNFLGKPWDKHICPFTPTNGEMWHMAEILHFYEKDISHIQANHEGIWKDFYFSENASIQSHFLHDLKEQNGKNIILFFRKKRGNQFFDIILCRKDFYSLNKMPTEIQDDLFAYDNLRFPKTEKKKA